MLINLSDSLSQTVLFSIIFVCLLLVSIKKAKSDTFFSREVTNQLKGLAILAVIFAHIGYFLSTDTRFLYPLSVLGGVGVNLFLFLSGFGLTVSYIRSPLSPLAFYKKRFSKLFTPLWVAITIFLLADLFLLHRTYPPSEIIYSFLGFYPRADLFQNLDSPLWYFTIILFYYLIFPIVFIRKLPFISPFLALLLGLLVLNLSLPVNPDVLNLYKLHFIAFPLGMLFGQMTQYVKFKMNKFFKNLILIIGITTFLYTAIHSGVGQDPRIEQGLSLLTTLSAVAIFTLSGFEFKLLSLFGIYSYEIYLLHWPILSRYNLFLGLPPFLATIFSLILFIFLAYALQKKEFIYKAARLFKIRHFLSLIILLGLFSLWTYKGITETGIHADLARDLNYLSDIWIHKIVWLGPMTSANFPTSPIYYYLLFPGLLLSGGNGLSLIFSHAFFALLALGLFVYYQLKQSLVSTVLVILTIGLSPWWITASSLPWNGHMYVSWVFLALTNLWFKKPIFLSALLFGIAIAINPVAILAIPVLIFEWITSMDRKKNIIHILLGLLLPWTPIIIFEVITKGFLTRHFLQYPSSAGIFFSPKFANIGPLLNILRVNQIQAIVALLLVFFLTSKRGKLWIISACLPLIFLILFTSFRDYYLFGLVCALAFTLTIILSSKTIGKVILVVLIAGYVQTISIPPITYGGRSIQRMDNIITTFIQKSGLDKTKKYAVVSVRDAQNSTPQADDYRFFLRVKGFNILSIDQSPQADVLLLFIEVPNFKWQDWEDWHVQRFGQRKFLSDQNINGIEVVMYGR